MEPLIQNIFTEKDIASLKEATLYNQLVEQINTLIKDDFEKLVQLLYRIDVSEQKLKMLLQSNPNEDAAKLIASLIIERQIQKIELRKKTKEEGDAETNEERW